MNHYWFCSVLEINIFFLLKNSNMCRYILNDKQIFVIVEPDKVQKFKDESLLKR